MDIAWILPFLALVTILCVLVFALWSKEATERRKKSDVERSSLASDGDSHSAAP